MSEKNENDFEANRELKDNVFSLMFKENPKAAVSVSNAFLGTTYPEDTPVEFETLLRPLTKGRINDLAFVLEGRLVVLIEHQSTINDNMPYRMLQYIADTYKKLNKINNEYRNQKFMLQRPKFIVLYNGAEKMEENMRILRLSDMFAERGQADEPADDEIIDLELTVKMYNINRGHNEDILKNCAMMYDYSIFTGMIHEYHKERGMSPAQAVQTAVVDCIDQNILKEFLLNHKWEVINMLVSEWNMDVALEVREEEGAMKKALEIARCLKNRGDSVQSVADATGLTVDEVLKL